MARSPGKKAVAEADEKNADPDRHTSVQKIEGIVQQELDPVLGNLSRVQREQVISRVVGVVKSEAFSGPLPHPRHLEEYDLILPGGADRIFRMTEGTVEHNIAVSKKAQKDDHFYRILGMILGFMALVLLVGAAFYAGMNDNNILAGLFLGTGVLSSIGVFVSAHLRRE